MMSPKPKQWSPEYASVFQDPSVVTAYAYRPTHPPETFTFLAGLIPPTAPSRIVLDAGCGTGFIARFLAPHVDRVEAIDISSEMVTTGQSLPGGADPRIVWSVGSLETAPLQGPYALIVAGDSMHWLEWETVFPRFRAHLVPGGYLALVSVDSLPNPWDKSVGPILAQYSLNRDFQPYTMRTVAAELESRSLFHFVGSHETASIPFRQSIHDWVASFHARNGFSRDRMDPVAAAACDECLEQVITPYCSEGVVEQYIFATILWGTIHRLGGGGVQVWERIK
jgi:SAM-dependent methyltransferase